jgi:N-carbamoyl-L-amino-acid hydrolase
VDLRHADAGELAAMRDGAAAAARESAELHRCQVTESPVFAIAPTEFDPGLVAAAGDACREVAGSDRVLTSGALHDAANAARVVPAAMIFVRSRAGLSHAPEEDSSDEDLKLGVEALARATHRALSGA